MRRKAVERTCLRCGNLFKACPWEEKRGVKKYCSFECYHSVPVLDRFMNFVYKNTETGCWDWTGPPSSSGCGSFFYLGKPRDAYRVGYMLMIKELSSNEHLHHKCENRMCVNPDHLQVTTPKEHHTELTPHHLAYINSRKTHCPQGHEYSEDNLVKCEIAKGHRVCLICARKASRECQSRKKVRRTQDSQNHL